MVGLHHTSPLETLKGLKTLDQRRLAVIGVKRSGAALLLAGSSESSRVGLRLVGHLRVVLRVRPVQWYLRGVGLQSEKGR